MLGTALVIASLVVFSVCYFGPPGSRRPHEELLAALYDLLEKKPVPASMKLRLAGCGIGLLGAMSGMVLWGSTSEALPSSSGLTKSALPLVAQTVRGYWEEKDVIQNDIGRSLGSTFVWKTTRRKLILVTNRHCLALGSIYSSDPFDLPELIRYELVVRFPSGKQLPVERFAIAKRQDLALLEVNYQEVQKGTDFVVPPRLSTSELKVSEPVVAVGSPRGFEQTVTHGHISAFREVYEVLHIQHDAPVNPGNSGGPLLVNREERFFLIGINTWGVGNSEQLNFAISVDELDRAEFVWFPANAQGALNAAMMLYGH